MKTRKDIVCIYLVIVTIALRVVFDYLGAIGYFYNSVPQEAFQYSGYEAFLDIKYSLILYFAEMILFYISLLLFIAKSKFVLIPFVLCFILQIVMGITSGVYIGTPLESTISFIIGSSHLFLFSVVLLQLIDSDTRHGNLNAIQSP